MLFWKLALQGANWSKFKSLAWSIRVLQGALPKQPMTKLWLTFHYPIALDCCCIRVVNQKKWHSFLKLVQPPSTWESSNHLNPEVPHHKKQKRLVNVKTICTCCRLIDSTTSFACRMHLDSNHTSTGQLKGRRSAQEHWIGEQQKCLRHKHPMNRMAASICARIRAYCRRKWPPMGTMGLGVQAAVSWPCNLTEVGWAQQSKISQHHQQPPTLQPNCIHPRIVWFNGWLTRLRPSTFWECSRAMLLAQSSMWTLCKLVQLHCMSRWLVFNNKNIWHDEEVLPL